jgi:putative adhesin
VKRSVFIFTLLAGAAAWSQDTADRITVPFSDPSRPHTLKVHLINGSVTVKGYDGKDAVIETRHEPGEERERRHERVPRGAEGMKRITNTAMGLTAEEEDNVLTVGAHPGRDANLLIQVPVNTSLKLGVVNGGDIAVDHISGEIEVDNVNGGVTLTNISGSVIAHALNRNVVVKLNQITPDKSMSFSSLNGDIDVTLPADTKARVKLKTDNGDIYSDFDITLDPTARRAVVEDGRPNRGKYRVRVDRSMYGTINGGGPEFQFQTFNGNIYIRKPK